MFDSSVDFESRRLMVVHIFVFVEATDRSIVRTDTEKRSNP